MHYSCSPWTLARSKYSIQWISIFHKEFNVQRFSRLMFRLVFEIAWTHHIIFIVLLLLSGLQEYSLSYSSNAINKIHAASKLLQGFLQRWVVITKTVVLTIIVLNDVVRGSVLGINHCGVNWALSWYLPTLDLNLLSLYPLRSSLLDESMVGFIRILSSKV